MSINDSCSIKQHIAMRLRELVDTATICGSAEMVRVKHINELIDDLENDVTHNVPPRPTLGGGRIIQEGSFLAIIRENL